jgi:hypothetical protein
MPNGRIVVPDKDLKTWPQMKRLIMALSFGAREFRRVMK